ncbi:mitochondrial distribution/morphology family 35/apoptosis [Epithele typhae]|uniref:mitochondrial distribution/morphology family 35/apoptosis n=1 Tax=Epithele typhae TaxID=378194 RepID=UPI0020075632|nr:mitochondrial distribution/morphology family 35/apoptosis [Epithele typhae]KAH9930463.1 mitochondrial distribution/morphology family 35/apoptosis [Epithele typhae]
MAHSLSEECTQLKRKYDGCFNAWFEGYLEPAVSASATAEQRSQFSQEKAAEFERNCGRLWKEYRACVQKAVQDKGLTDLLDQARKENPLRDPPGPSSGSSGKS